MEILFGFLLGVFSGTFCAVLGFMLGKKSKISTINICPNCHSAGCTGQGGTNPCPMIVFDIDDGIEVLADCSTTEETPGTHPDKKLDEIIMLCREYRENNFIKDKVRELRKWYDSPEGRILTNAIE